MIDVVNWSDAGVMLLKLVFGMLLGGAIGWERELSGRPAGVRTHMMVCVGVILFTEIGGAYHDSRIAAQIVTGIGFLGAGTILRMGGQVVGLTTAASVWATAAIGMGVATGGTFMVVAVGATILGLITLSFVDDLEERFIQRRRRRQLRVVLDSKAALHDVIQKLNQCQISVVGLNNLGDEHPVEVTLDLKGDTRDALAQAAELPSVQSANWLT